jgi:hypothetical protein
LQPASYVIEITADTGGQKTQALIAIRITA